MEEITLLGENDAEVADAEKCECTTECCAEVGGADGCKCEKVMLTTEQYEALKVGFKSYYEALLRAVRTTKQKDITLAKVTKELQKYREGFGKSLVKPVAISLISFFEDNKKTLREIDNYAKDKDSVLKYLGYTLSDMESILELYDIREESGTFTVKGKPIGEDDVYAEAEMPEVKVPEESAEQAIAFEDGECTLDTLLEFMKIGQARVEAAVADTEYLDVNIENYSAVASITEKNYTLTVMAPVYRKLAGMYTLIKNMVDDAEARITDENCREIYSEALSVIVSETSDVLTYIGVEILEVITSEYDPKTSKILKVIATDDPELDKTVAVRHTDCYSIDGVVIQPAKVSVYKLS